MSEGSPTQKKRVYLGIAQIAQIRALCGTTILPKMRKFFKKQFWLWEWIFWQWLRSKMILRWYSDGNQGKYWWNWWKLGGSVLVYVHCRTATNNLGKRFNPPPFGQCPNLPVFFGVGLPLVTKNTLYVFSTPVFLKTERSLQAVAGTLLSAWRHNGWISFKRMVNRFGFGTHNGYCRWEEGIHDRRKWLQRLKPMMHIWEDII